MRFIDISGTLAKARRNVSGSGAPLSEQDIAEPRRLSEALRDLVRRVGDLEGKSPPEGLEIEKDVSTGGALVTIEHNFNSSVRWWVTSWKNASSGHSLVWNTASDTNKLVLASYVAGRAVIRVEPSQYGLS